MSVKYRKKDKNGVTWVDDGHSVTDMNVGGMRGRRRKKAEIEPVEMTKEEKRAICRAGWFLALKMFGLILAFFGVCILVVFLWLR